MYAINISAECNRGKPLAPLGAEAQGALNRDLPSMPPAEFAALLHPRGTGFPSASSLIQNWLRSRKHQGPWVRRIPVRGNYAVVRPPGRLLVGVLAVPDGAHVQAVCPVV